MGYASKDLREAAVAAIKEGKGSKSYVARFFGITRKTLRSWLKIDADGGEQVPKSERGHPPCILNETDYANIYSILKETPFTTCAEMITRLNLSCSAETMRRAYHKLGFTHKKRTRYASQKLKEENVAKRDNFLEMRKDFDPEHLVFIDESCVKTNHSPRYGWALSSERCVGYAPCSWKAITVIGALRLKEKWAPLTVTCEETVTREAFKEFMEDELLSTLRRGDIVVMDNASIHKNSFSIQRVKRKGVRIVYLPPYCPELNPIENMWSKMKSILRKMGARAKDTLKKAISAALWEITPGDREGWFRGCGYIH